MKTKKVGLLLVILLALLSGGIFTATEDVSAYKCVLGTDCDGVGVGPPYICDFGDPSGASCSGYDHACSAQHSWSSIDVCLIDMVSGSDCCSSASCPLCNPVPYNTFQFCNQGTCKTLESGDPKDEPSLNARGIKCWVSEKNNGGSGPEDLAGALGDGEFVEGVWEYWGTDGQCIDCGANNKQIKVYGNSSSLEFDGSIADSGNNKFEYVCGADASCDELAEGSCVSGNWTCSETGKLGEYFDCASYTPPKICGAGGKCEEVAAACDTNPTVEIDPPSKSGSKGAELTYKITVTNNDDNSCPTSSRTFALTEVHPGGWANPPALTDKTISKKNSDGTANSKIDFYQLTSPGDAAAGLYDFTITAADGDGSYSAEGYYYVTDCPPGIVPETNLRFEESLYSTAAEEWVKFEVKNTTGASTSVLIENSNGNTKLDDTSDDIGGFWDPFEYQLKTTDRTGVWTGRAFAVDCKVTTLVVECYKDSHCSGTDICNSDNECETASVPVDPPADCTKTEDPRELTCDDGIDNDCDGFFDCDDLDCVGNPVCDGGGEGGEDPVVAPCGLGTGELCNPLADRTTGAGWASVTDIAQGMLNYLLGLVGSIALLFLIIAGVMYMTAGGSEEKITTAKKILTGAIIGLAIVLLAYSLLAEVNKILSP